MHIIIIEKIDKIVTKIAPNTRFSPHDKNDTHELIMNSINAKINKIIVGD